MLNTYQSHSFIGCESSFDDAQIVIVGAPFDGTTSYRPGTRFAPNQIRIDSYGLETYSPYLDLDLEDYQIADIGDIEFPFGNTPKVLDAIEENISTIVDANKKPLMIGGEHLVSLPAFKALVKKYPDLHIIHFDAHTDLREHYMGEKLSHATVIRRGWDILGDDKIFQFGIRSGTKEEFEWAKSHTHLNLFDASTLESILPKLQGKPVYLTIDLDVLDPSIFSGTGTPEPGGMMMKEFLDALIMIKELNFVGADVVELSPHYDPSGVSNAVACKVIREVALLLSK
ncbi:MAG: agmatinase [Epulopiscium sp. Nele67-Bin005]|nr:MAG: agmatinase [Epulopiscium sp. Nele67-Bin005]